MTKAEKERLRRIRHSLSKFKNCWICGEPANTDHHVPPRCSIPKLWIKIPVCRKCHNLLNSGHDYTAKEKRSLRSNIRKIEKSVKNIRRNLLDN